MRRENLFYLLVLIAIAIVRIDVYLIPNVDIVLWGFVIHHYFFGIVTFASGLFFDGEGAWRMLFFAAGLGLVIDELTFLFLGGGGDVVYWGISSLLGTALFVIILYPLRHRFA